MTSFHDDIDYLTTLSRSTTVDLLVRKLRSEIQRGALVPGQRLRQREIAMRFDVSTTPVREAFQVLQADGYLRWSPQRGAIIALPTADELREGYDIRKSLEQLAAAHAIVNLREEDFQRLRKCLAQMQAPPPDMDWIAMNDEFHSVIYEAARMPRLMRLMRVLRESFAYYVESAYNSEEQRVKAVDDHARILAMCENRDVVGLRQEVADHLEHTAQIAIANRIAMDLAAKAASQEEGGLPLLERAGESHH